MAVLNNSNFSPEVMAYYESRFLDRAKATLVMKEGGDSQTQSQNVGPSITFTRISPLAFATSALTQGTNPADIALTEANVTVTLAEYGTTLRLAKFSSLTLIDKGNAEKISVLGQNMGETLDDIAAIELFTNATVQFANARASLITVAAGDNFNSTEIKKAVRTLEENKAMPYSDGAWMGKVQPRTKYDLISDTVWVSVKEYSDPQDLYTGEMGELYGVRFLLSNKHKKDAAGGAGGIDVYSNFIHGAHAFGTYDLEGDMPQLIIKQSGPQDTSNPANRFSTISWAGSYAAKVLNPAWIVNVKSAASV